MTADTVKPITDEERNRVISWVDKGDRGFPAFVKPSIRSYEARLAATENENAKLREALKPFAGATLYSQSTAIGFSDGSYFYASEGYKNVHCAMKGDAVEHFNRARNALNESKAND